jgi:hypothetical protein
MILSDGLYQMNLLERVKGRKNKKKKSTEARDQDQGDTVM